MDELPSSVELTPDLSRTEPNVYKSALLGKFRNNTKYGAAALDLLSTASSFSPDKITFNPDSWHSKHDGEEGTMTLGTGIMTGEEKVSNFPFETNAFHSEKITLHVFSHEIAHFVGDYLADQIEGNDQVSEEFKKYESLVKTFISLRDQPVNAGVTSHGNDKRYFEKGTQGIEDMTDLLAFYISDPDYLKRYLSFLANPEFKEKRNKHNLVSLSEQSTSVIYDIIDNTMQSVFSAET